MSWSNKPIVLAAAISAVSLFPAHSQDAIRIGVLNDMAGPYASYQGPGSVVAAQMAVEDYGGKAGGKKVEGGAAGSQNKGDLGVASAPRWGEKENVSGVF